MLCTSFQPRIIGFISFILLSTIVYGRSAVNIDSLEVLLSSQVGEEKIETLLELAKAQGGNAPRSSQEYARSAVELSLKLTDPRLLARSYYYEGRSFRLMGDLPVADSLLNQAVSGADTLGMPTLAAQIYNELGTVSIFQGKVEQARNYFTLGLEQAQSNSNFEMIGAMYILETGINHMRYDLEGMETSLKKALEAFQENKNIAGQASVYSNLANVYFMRGENDLAIQWYDSARHISRIGKDHTTYAITTVNKGNALLHLGRFETAVECGTEALAVSEEHRLQNSLVNANNLLADIWTTQSNFGRAMPYLENALNVSLETEAHEQSIRLYESVGANHFNLGNYQSAIDHYLRGFELAEELEFDLGKEAAYQRIAKVYAITLEPQKALRYLDKSLVLAMQHGDPYRQGTIHQSIAEVYLQNDSFDLARSYFDTVFLKYGSAKRQDQFIDPQLGMAHLTMLEGNIKESKQWIDKCKASEISVSDANAAKLNWIEGRLLVYSKDHTLALEKFHTSLQLAENTNGKKIILDCYTELAIAYEQIGDFENALRYSHLKQTLQDEILDYRKSYDISRLKAEFDVERKEEEIALLEQKQLVDTLRSEQQLQELRAKRNTNIFLLIVLILTVVLGFLLFKRFRSRKVEETLALEVKQVRLEKENVQAVVEREAAELRSKFFADVSHELRTPLTLIAGPVEQLVETASEKDLPSLSLIHQNTQRLIGLVDQTLDLSKLEQGHMPLFVKDVDINMVVRRNVELFQMMAKDKRICFKFTSSIPDRTVQLDASKIDLIIVNLLGNAFRYTPDGGTIKVALSADQDRIQLVVEDSGRGIPKVDQGQIFQRFYQVENGKKQGSGIGLALTKELVELHRGTISFRSRPNGGTVFTVALPCSLGDEEDVREPVSTVITGTSHSDSSLQLDSATILVVEDNLEVQHFIAGLLSPHYKVVTAINGREGIELAEKEGPDLIVSDIMMPGIEGIELTQRLKGNLLTSHIPVILLTAKGAHKDKLEGLQSGADDYLTKPFSTRELLIRVNNLIVQRQKLRELFSKNVFTPPRKFAASQLDESFLTHATEIVEKNFTEPDFNVTQLCSDLALNRNSVHQKLTTLTGLSPTYFIRAIKLKKAAELLDDQKLSIIQIAELSGYNSRQSFNKAFKAQFEMTPSAYRNR